MQTEFTCGIYTVKINSVGTRWHLDVNDFPIASIEKDGTLLTFTTKQSLSQDMLIEIILLMNNIKRQYNQLQTTTT